MAEPRDYAAKRAARDYLEWHREYDDPESSTSWRLATVRNFISQALDRQPHGIRLLSVCAGDGRDVLGVLAERRDAIGVRLTLLEIHPVLAERAQQAATRLAGRAEVEVRAIDAGNSDAYVDAVPADVVLMVGVFGNISTEDLTRTLGILPQLCAPGATVIWTHARQLSWQPGDRTPLVRRLFHEAGFAETDFVTLHRDNDPSVGVARYDGAAVPLETGVQLFTFVH